MLLVMLFQRRAIGVELRLLVGRQHAAGLADHLVAQLMHGPAVVGFACRVKLRLVLGLNGAQLRALTVRERDATEQLMSVMLVR